MNSSKITIPKCSSGIPRMSASGQKRTYNQVGRLRPLENAIDVERRTAVRVVLGAGVRHQASLPRKQRGRTDGRQTMLQRQIESGFAWETRLHDHGIGPLFVHGRKRRIELLHAADLDRLDCNAQGAAAILDEFTERS